MNRFASPLRAGLWLAGAAVVALAVWAAAEHRPRDPSATAAAAQPRPVAAHACAADAAGCPAAAECPGMQTADQDCPPCPACPVETAAPTAHVAKAEAPAASAGAGMVAAIDPETGELGAPSPEQAAALRPLPTAAVPGQEYEEIRNADGSVTVVDLSGRLQEYAVVQIGPDGKLLKQCVSGAKQAAAALRAPVARPAAPEVK